MEYFKICTKCKSKFPAITDFWNKQKAGRYGLRSVCKQCEREIAKEYRQRPETKESHRIKAAEWRKNNTEKVLEINKKSYNIHKEEYNQKRRERFKNDIEYRKKIIEREKRYIESGRRYEINNKPEQREKARIRSKKRRESEEKRKHDYIRQSEWRKENKKYLQELWATNRKELKPSYIACSLRLKVKDLTPEILETRQIIIKLKRELKSNNIKIK